MRRFHIDMRPLPLLFLREYRNALVLALLTALFLVFIHGDSPDPALSTEAYRAMVIFVLAVILWVSNLLPLAITSLLVLGLLAHFEVMAARQVYSFFGNSALFFILGAFIISAAVQASGLSKRIAVTVLRACGKEKYSLICGVFFLSAGLSHIMPEHAVAALMYPILRDILPLVETEKKSGPFQEYLFFSMAWGCIIGGVVTFLGGARNPLAIGILQEMSAADISMGRWIIAAAPPMYILGALVLLFFRLTLKDDAHSSIHIAALPPLPKIHFREIKAGVILSVTIALWVFGNARFGIANIALISASLFFVLNVLSWEEAKNEINWGIILMYGGAIALGTSLDRLGVLELMVDTHLSTLQLSPLLFIGAIAAISIILTDFVSNAAVIVILLPAAIRMAPGAGISPELATLSIAIPSGLAFMLPMSTPAMAIIYGSGKVNPARTLRYGLVLNTISWIFCVSAATWYWPRLGI